MFNVSIHEDDAGREEPSSHIATLDLCLGDFCILAHEQCIPVHLGIGIVEKLVHEAKNLLVPPLDVGCDFPFSVILVQADEASGIAQLKGHGVQFRKHGRPGLLRKAIYGNDSNVLLFGAVIQVRNEATYKGFAAKQGIQIHRHCRNPERMQNTCYAGLQIGKQVRVQERFDVLQLILCEPRHGEDM